MATLKSKLKAVTPKAAEPSRPKVLVFGKYGCGKSYFATSFPSCYYIDTEGGADLEHYTNRLSAGGGMYMGPDQGSQDFETVLSQVQALGTEQHNFRTLVIDSTSKLWNNAITQEQERLGDKDAYGASKKPAVQQMRRLAMWINRLDLNVLMIGHEKDVWSDKGKIGVDFDCDPKLAYELHLILHLTKQGSSHYACPTKSRLLGFPEGERFEISYDSFAARYGRDVIEKAATQIEIASPEQVAEISKLIDTVKMPDGQEDKWLTAAGVAVWEDMDASKIQKCIDALKAKLA